MRLPGAGEAARMNGQAPRARALEREAHRRQQRLRAVLQGSLPLALALALAACGGRGGSPSRLGAAYERKVERIAERRCRADGLAKLAGALHVAATRAAVVRAYARTWPADVRAAASAG